MGGHSVLERYPVDGSVQLGGETLPTPYQVHDGTMLMVAGSCDLDAASSALAPLGLRATHTTDRRALAAVWVADFIRAGLGPHAELQVSLLTGPAGRGDLSPGPWAFYEALSGQDQVWMLCHRLWNTTPRVVRYNDAHLQLVVALARGGLRQEQGRWSFEFSDEAGRLLAQGSSTIPSRTKPRHGLSLARALGWKRSRQLASRVDQSIGVVSPRKTQDGNILVASTHTQAEHTAFRPWDSSDEIHLSEPDLARLDFRPDLVAAFGSVQFVYLRPTPQPLGR